MDYTFNEAVFWNMNSYGTAMRLPRGVLRGLVAVLCLATPATNWLLPFIFKAIRRDLMVRYER